MVRGISGLRSGEIADLFVFIGLGAMITGSLSRTAEWYIGASGLVMSGFTCSFCSMMAIWSLTLRVGGAGICSYPFVGLGTVVSCICLDNE